ncbi:hypothetical protein HOE04_03915 [archaeon]|jgi:hypothetical protein|nr:hypothetical protein [archaeon]
MTIKTIEHWDLEKGSQELGSDTDNSPIYSDLHGVRYNGNDYIVDEREEKLENAGVATVENPNATRRDELKLIAPDRIWQVTHYDSQREVATVSEVKDSRLILNVLAELDEKHLD